VYVLRPLETAKIFIDFRDLPDGFRYNEHFSIVILNSEGEKMTLPHYFDEDVRVKFIFLE